ncbi:MAG: GatB/YqeY domain-containing protein [Candidatus Margulisiibacteriota bacterium]
MAEEKKELLNKINEELKNALKSKNELRLSVLRMMKSKILYVNARGDLPDAEITKILTKYGKEVKESIGEFNKVGRAEDAAKSEKELAIVQEFLPKQLSPDEIKSVVQQTVKEVGATSIKEMGNVMKAVLAKQPGIDGKIVSQLVRELLK